jgi:hypothetical protein
MRIGFKVLAALGFGTLVAAAIASPIANAAADNTRPTGRHLADPAGDMFVMTSESPGTYRPAPGQEVDDVITVAVAHQHTKVLVTSHFTDLRRVGAGHSYQFKFRTPNGIRMAVLMTRHGHWRGRLMVGDRFDTMPCAGKRSTIRYDEELLRVAIPRSCLGRPAWVQLQQRNAWWREPSGTMYVDNAHNSRPKPRGFTARVYRG